MPGTYQPGAGGACGDLLGQTLERLGRKQEAAHQYELAVVANGVYAARKGRDALKVEWDDTKAETRSSHEMIEDYRKIASGAVTPPQYHHTTRSSSSVANILR